MNLCLDYEVLSIQNISSIKNPVLLGMETMHRRLQKKKELVRGLMDPSSANHSDIVKLSASTTVYT